MTARGVLISEQRPALEEIRAICEEIDPQGGAMLSRHTPGGAVPSSGKQREEYDLFVLESLLILARAVRGKKRGRKPNVQWHENQESKAS
jgi:hypothetical protein